MGADWQKRSQILGATWELEQELDIAPPMVQSATVPKWRLLCVTRQVQASHTTQLFPSSLCRRIVASHFYPGPDSLPCLVYSLMLRRLVVADVEVSWFVAVVWTLRQLFLAKVLNPALGPLCFLQYFFFSWKCPQSSKSPLLTSSSWLLIRGLCGQVGSSLCGMWISINTL